MVLQLCIMIQKRQQWQTNAPHPPAILMALAVRCSNTDGITQCRMSRATPEATGCRHRATTHSESPQRPPGKHQTKQQQKNVPKRLAIFDGCSGDGYNTVHIAQWRRFRALLEATKCYHWAKIAANRCNWSCMCRFFTSLFILNLYKKVAGQVKDPCFQ